MSVLATPITHNTDVAATQAELEAQRQTLLTGAADIIRARQELNLTLREYNAAHGFASVNTNLARVAGNRLRSRNLDQDLRREVLSVGIHRVLQSLPPSYKNFVMNYNMQNMNKELPELFSMLKSAEVEIQKEHQVLMVNKTTSFKKQGKPKKGNFKKGSKKVAAPPEKPKAGPKPDTECYYCKEKGHWKRNCPKYMADLKSGLVKKKKGIFDIHVIDVYLTGSRSSKSLSVTSTFCSSMTSDAHCR
nr:uncharacterized protein LOC127303235 [Lolium perenne]